MNKKERILSPKIDVIFQALFGEIGNEKITKDFLSAILEEEIIEINLRQNPILKRLNLKDKMGILDLIVEINNNEYCNVEMQVTKQEDLVERGLFYWAKLFSRGISKGEEYKKLKRTITILIVDFEINDLEEEEYCTKWKLIEDKRRKRTLTNKIEVIIIELPKIYKANIKDSKLLEWLYFIDNPSSKEVKEIMLKNDSIKEADKKLKEIYNDGQLYQIMKWREDGIRLEKARERRDREREKLEIEIRNMQKVCEDQRKENENQKRENENQKRENENQKRENENQKRENEKQEKNLRKKEEQLNEKEKDLEIKETNIIKAMKKQGLDIEVIHNITGWSIEDIETI